MSSSDGNRYKAASFKKHEREAEALLKSLQDEKNELSGKLAASEKKTAQLTETTTKLQQELNAAANNVASLNELKESLQYEKNELIRKLAVSEQKTAKLSESSAKLQQKLEAIENFSSGISFELKNLEEQLKKKQAILVQFQNDAEATKENLEFRIDVLDGEIKFEREQRDKLKVNFEKIKKYVAELKEKYDLLKNHVRFVNQSALPRLEKMENIQVRG